MKRSTGLGLGIILLYSLLSRAYLLIRYNGNWIDGDTAVMAAISKATALTGRFDTPGFPAYSGGFGYQAFVVFLTETTGVSIVDIQLYILPFMGVLVVLISFVVFSKLFQRDKPTLVATSLLAVHPYTLFVTSQGSHMALTLTTVFVILWIWLSLLRKDTGRRSLMIIILLIAIFSLVALNVFFALSILISFVGTFFVATIFGSVTERRSYWRLGSTTLFGVVLLFFTVIFAYEPAIDFLRATPNISGVLSAVFFSFGESTIAVYSTGGVVWLNPFVYLFLFLFELIVIPISVASWIWYGVRQGIFGTSADQKLWTFLWLLNGAFGLLVVTALIFDLFGGIGFGDNIALRLVPMYLVTGVPWTARFVFSVASSIRSDTFRKALSGALALILLLFAAAAPLRAFVDPVVAPVSWVGFDIEERRVADWLHQYVPVGTVVFAQPIYENNIASRIVWLYTMITGPGKYGAIHFPTEYPGSSGTTIGDMYYTSSREVARSPFIHASLPDVSTWSRVYDNNEAQLYYKGWSAAGTVW